MSYDKTALLEQMQIGVFTHVALQAICQAVQGAGLTLEPSEMAKLQERLEVAISETTFVPNNSCEEGFLAAPSMR